jgi:hypothetical protein
VTDLIIVRIEVHRIHSPRRGLHANRDHASSETSESTMSARDASLF